LFFESEFGVITTIASEATIFQLNDFIGHDIEQIAVVRNNDYAALVAADEFLQKTFACQVEMIIRFV